MSLIDPTKVFREQDDGRAFASSFAENPQNRAFIQACLLHYAMDVCHDDDGGKKIEGATEFVQRLMTVVDRPSFVKPPKFGLPKEDRYTYERTTDSSTGTGKAG